MQQHTLVVLWKFARHHSAPYKKIGLPVFIKIHRDHTGTVEIFLGQCINRAGEISFAIVYIQTILVLRTSRLKFSAGTNYIKIHVFITISIKEKSATVFHFFISNKGRDILCGKNSVRSLDHQFFIIVS